MQCSRDSSAAKIWNSRLYLSSYWPPHSPDLNPEDYKYRDWCNRQCPLQKAESRDIGKLRECIVEEWEWLDQSVTDSVIREWRCRLRGMNETKRWIFWAQTVINRCLGSICHSAGWWCHLLAIGLLWTSQRYKRVISRISRMLRGATQPVRMPCVCMCLCVEIFFSEQPPHHPTPPPCSEGDNIPLGFLVSTYTSLELEPILVLTLIGGGLAGSGLNQIGGYRPSRSDGNLTNIRPSSTFSR